MNEYSFIFQINRATRRFPIRIKGKTNDKHHRILEAAVKVFAEKGFFQSTISQIAKEAGVADGTIYLYFKNKDDILTQFFSYKTKLVFDRFKEAVEEGPNAIEKLRNLIRKHLEEFQRDRNMAVVYQTETHQITRMAEYQIKKMSKKYLDIVSEIVEQGQQEGSIRRSLYLGLVKRLILGSVDEVINTWLHSKKNYDLISMADPLVELIIEGLGKKRETDHSS
ncbi:MAG: TetR/AcrR family transcriptional regulator [Desulfobacterales bacterium]|jgi:TetR/AcrR family fatty acid metabolism transcriptional regulator|nr:TetR family transcriptional regulator [Desulfobacter sp.]MDP6394666.1 TetR/AcrR family transcriptional regulator [Desulfobacterales bacterium]MDP6681633.1 TetR/AcrR family transcriptional regulator [Desulfobacterales bacterium]MDP6806741.1 TetR/AcrR family transcriptional regulator [Desulfobacterales bacterium]|tara:strand:+ start:16914 stop:17582 length:669 start_codon:yes stop_codon:yes gene_type:complete